MAVRFNAVAEAIRRTTNLPNYNSTYTMMAWYYVVNFTNTGFGNMDLMVLSAPSDASLPFDLIQITHSGAATPRQLILFTTNPQTAELGSQINGTTWYHLAMVRESATSLKLYLDGVLDITNTLNVGTSRVAPTHMDFGAWSLATSRTPDFRVKGIKVWAGTALTAEQIKIEMQTLRPHFYTNLNTFDPVFTGSGERTRDYSGNGYNLSEVGTLTDEDDPPVSYGAPPLIYPIAVGAAAQTISPTGIDSTASVGGPTLTGAATISPSGVASTVAIGSHTLSGAATISPGGIASTAQVGEPSLSGAATIGPSGVGSTATVGEPTLTGAATISPTGVASTSSVGSHTLTPGGVTISPSGISSTVTIGNPIVTDLGNLISPVGIPSTLTIGNPWITTEESPECIRDWNIDDVVLTRSQVIIQQMTLPRSTGTPSGDHDWTI